MSHASDLWTPTEPWHLAQVGQGLLVDLSLTDPSRKVKNSALAELPEPENWTCRPNAALPPQSWGGGTSTALPCPRHTPPRHLLASVTHMRCLMGEKVSVEGRIHDAGDGESARRCWKDCGHPQWPMSTTPAAGQGSSRLQVQTGNKHQAPSPRTPWESCLDTSLDLCLNTKRRV